MHKKIYQICPGPIPEEEWITSSDITPDDFRSFFGHVADYVVDCTLQERDEAIQKLWLRLRCEDCAISERANIFMFSSAFKSKYFAAHTEILQHVVNSLANRVTLENVIEDVDLALRFNELQMNLCDDFDDYVYTEEGELIPFDDFVRFSEPAIAYYIGGVCDFKF